jgi:hypothetical protein
MVTYTHTIGSCEVPLSALRDFRKTALNLPLADTPTGSLLLKLEYIPLQVCSYYTSGWPLTLLLFCL